MNRVSRQLSARERILDSAEISFAEDGFSGSSMKAIALRADVAQGLLHYHFDNKEGLYAAVIERRSSVINEERLKQLEEVDLSAPDAVSQIFRAFFEPPLGAHGGGRAYARILAGLNAGDTRDAELVRRYYDGAATRFVDALQEALPHAPRLALGWGYSLALGALIAAISNSGRPQRLGDTDPEETTKEDVLEKLVTYVEGGVRALAAAPD